MSRHLKVSVWRSNDADYHQFLVPSQDSQTVLDVVSWIQQNELPDLSYRYACRVGMCGSCAMMVNGEPRWTCRTHVNKVLKDDQITIGPLRNLPVIKDLVTDMDPFFDKWVEAEAVFHPTKTRQDQLEPILPKSAKRQQASAAIECINCAICYSACDVVASNSDYLGPAALNRAWSLVNDVRDGGHDKRLEAISSSGGCHNCHSQSGCASYCPNDLNPTASIAGLKRETIKSWWYK
ncbi:MAG: 2Fe-2S iron-sulfur cluster-binding protein [Rhizobiaceae bacterium]